jgi:hypothetical protein
MHLLVKSSRSILITLNLLVLFVIFTEEEKPANIAAGRINMAPFWDEWDLLK